jgi:hypothetical protein
MTGANPFTERGRITDPAHFAGRWGELSLIFERLEAGRPVLVAGSPGVGKSSLLTHIVQSAAVNLELPELRAYYLDTRDAEGTADIYRVVSGALGQRGDTIAALEVALVAADAPVLLCLDNVQGALAAGWGEILLEALARVARGNSLLLVAALEGDVPRLSEPFAPLRLGALAQTEVRLLTETYLDGTGVSFTPAELRDVAGLSGAHPAYVQRAAFHLFQSKLDPSYEWRAAYRAEVRSRPIPGAPLPPAVFGGKRGEGVEQSGYGETADRHATPAAPLPFSLPDAAPVLILLAPLLVALLLFLATGSIVLAAVSAVAALAVAILLLRRTGT